MSFHVAASGAASASNSKSVTRPAVDNSRLKVLHVELGSQLFGGPRQVADLINGLAAFPGKHTLACAASNQLMVAALHNPESGLHRIEMSFAEEFDLSLIPKFRRIIRLEQPDLLHIHCRRADMLCAIAGGWEHIPIIFSCRNIDPPSAFERRFKFPRFNEFVAISSAVKDMLLRNGIPADKIHYVPDGVDTRKFRPGPDPAWFREEFGVGEADVVIGVVASLVPSKGHSVLFDALPAVFDKHPKLRVLIFGQGYLEAQLKRRVKDAGWDQRVSFFGFRRDMDRVMPNLTLLAHPSWKEGLSVALLEAASSGVPIVASRAGGIPEVVRDGVNGRLVEPGDSQGFASAISDLLDRTDGLAKMGAEGRRLMESSFSIDRMVEGNYRVYEAMMARSP
jgi:glycosyltransferase involved in cell wall biosynthesis